MDLRVEEVFKLPIGALKLSQSHPDAKKDLVWFLTIIIAQGLYALSFVIFMSNIILYNIKDNDFVQTCKNGTMCVVIASGLFLYSNLVWKKKYVRNLFESIKSDYTKAKTQTAEEQEIVTKYANLSIDVGKMWVFVGAGATLIFPVKSVILHSYYYCIGDFRWIHLYDAIYPKIINDRKNEMGMFCFINIAVIISSSYGSCIYCAFSPLGPNFLLHACGQVEILTKRVDRLFAGERTINDILNELREISLEVKRIYDFVEDIEHSFRIVYEVILKVSSVVLPLTIYEIIKAFGHGEISIEFIVYTTGSFLISSSPCYYSEKLMEKGDLFRMAIYSCNWEKTWDRRTRTMILLLLQRAGRPIAIRTIFKTLCLDTLTDMCRQSYALFNLMNAMWD